jgi:hypothetical protein
MRIEKSDPDVQGQTNLWPNNVSIMIHSAKGFLSRQRFIAIRASLSASGVSVSVAEDRFEFEYDFNGRDGLRAVPFFSCQVMSV